jgi:hypothetical protein
MEALALLPWWNRKYKGVYSTRSGFRASMWHGAKMQHCRVRETLEQPVAWKIAPHLLFGVWLTLQRLCSRVCLSASGSIARLP